jgi:hypothetical protein
MLGWAAKYTSADFESAKPKTAVKSTITVTIMMCLTFIYFSLNLTLPIVKQYSIKKALNWEIKRKDSHRGHRGHRGEERKISKKMVIYGCPAVM